MSQGAMHAPDGDEHGALIASTTHAPNPADVAWGGYAHADRENSAGQLERRAVAHLASLPAPRALEVSLREGRAHATHQHTPTHRHHHRNTRWCRDHQPLDPPTVVTLGGRGSAAQLVAEWEAPSPGAAPPPTAPPPTRPAPQPAQPAAGPAAGGALITAVLAHADGAPWFAVPRDVVVIPTAQALPMSAASTPRAPS